MRPAPSTWPLAMARRLLMWAAVRLLGAQHRAWGQAMLAETKAIEDERASLGFAWGCFCAALGPAFDAARTGLAQVHPLGLLLCSATVVSGCFYMHGAGAPGHYVWMNLLSLALAMATFRLLPLQRLRADELLRAKLAFAMGAGLLAAGLGTVSPGAATWPGFGPVPLNVAWLLLPPLLVAADVRPVPATQRWALGGLLMACLALTLMADVVLMALAAVVVSVLAWRGRSAALALLAGATTLMAMHLQPRWQAPAALDFVDRVLSGGLAHGLALGGVLALLQLLPLVPAWRHRRARVHGLVWGLLVALSLPGWLPSPWLGFGGSFIVAYLLSLALVADGPAERLFTRPGRTAHRRRRHRPPLTRSRLT